MNILEEKREINNTLFRRYHSSNSQENSIELSALVNYNYDLVAYTIFKYFPKLKSRKDICEVGASALISAIESYEMDKSSDFEEYVVASIKNSITIYEDSIKPILVSNLEAKFNYGDIWYSREHNIKQILNTKNMRDDVSHKVFKKNMKKNKSLI